MSKDSFCFQVLVHNPHYKSQPGSSAEGDLSLLSINQQVSAVCAGRLNPNVQNDVLAVGTQTNLMVYDIEKNRDLFYKDVSCLLVEKSRGTVKRH